MCAYRVLTVCLLCAYRVLTVDDWVAGLLDCWVAGWPGGCVVGWLGGWVAGWLGWLGGRAAKFHQQYFHAKLGKLL